MIEDKYATCEAERRFLLDALPPGAADPRRIVDRYIADSRLRLRSVERPGAVPERKLGHKRRPAPDDPTVVMHTSLYLDQGEFDLLSSLPARILAKTRWSVDVAGRACSVDEFDHPLAGLLLLEVDLGHPSALDQFVPPPWAGPEVTRIEAFTGGRLAGASPADLDAIDPRFGNAARLTPPGTSTGRAPPPPGPPERGGRRGRGGR
jgi:hypothetical protein